eukprot:347376_1
MFGNDEICLICNHWAEDENDLMNNFIQCSICPQSYHKHCIQKQYGYQISFACNQIFKHGEYQCCISREPCKKLVLDEPPFKIEYYQIINGRKIKGISKKARISHQKYYACKRYKKICWKNMSFSSGDNVEINGNIGRIKEFFVDEKYNIPFVTVIRYWFEKELQAELVKLKYGGSLNYELPNACKSCDISKHVYLDLKRICTKTIDCIKHKVLLCETFISYKQILDTNWLDSTQFEDVFYGKWAFDLKYGQYPFMKINDAIQLIGNKINIQTEKLRIVKKSYHSLNKREKIYKQITKPLGVHSKSRKRNRIDIEVNDDKISNKLKIKNKIQKKTSICTSKHNVKVTYKHNMMLINTVDETKRICNKIGITECFTGNLYYFKSHFAVYQCIESLFDENDCDSFKELIDDKPQSYCRDIKYHMNVRGRVVPIKTMRENICNKFTQLKQCKRNTDATDISNKIQTPPKKRPKISTFMMQ